MVEAGWEVASHGWRWIDYGALPEDERLDVEDVGMHAAPLTHGSGHNALVFTMKGCSQLIHQPSGFDVELFLEQVPKYGVNALFMVPTMIKMVLDDPQFRPATPDASPKT